MEELSSGAEARLFRECCGTTKVVPFHKALEREHLSVRRIPVAAGKRGPKRLDKLEQPQMLASGGRSVQDDVVRGRIVYWPVSGSL